MESGKQNNYMLFLAIVIAGGLIAAAIFFSSSKSPFNTNNEISQEMPNVKDNQAPEGAIQGESQKEKRLYIATAIGIDEAKFKECVDKNEVDEINKDNEYAKSIGVLGTPNFFIGKVIEDNKMEGQKISGALPYEVFKLVIDSWINNNKPIDPQQIVNELPEFKDIPNIEEFVSKDVMEVMLDDDPVKGNNDARVVIVEFSDFECPYCKRHSATAYRQINDNYIVNDKIKYVYRDFIAVSGHNPAAIEAAVAANCAKSIGGDEKYYEYHDRYFQNTAGNGRGL